MKTIRETLHDLNSHGRSAFIPYLTAGVPDLQATVEMILGMSRLGVSVVELGVPFSDPVADGPVNMRAMEMALEKNTSLRDCLEVIRLVRVHKCEIPIIIFSYLNPVLAMGVPEFAAAAVAAGANGVLLVDLPIEEADEVWDTITGSGLEMIFLTSPTTAGQRLGLFLRHPPAFLYYVSRLGVTGAQTSLSATLRAEVDNVRQLTGGQLPICVGFGISTAAQVKEVAQFAEGVIAGSVLMQELIAQPLDRGPDRFLAKVKELMAGL
jgi:tryptophan synthase alpha subunit